MTVQGQKFEYKVLVGAKSTESGNLHLITWQVGDGRNEIPEAEFIFSDTSDAETIVEDQVVEFYRREVGEVVWGDSCFYGCVRAVTKPLRGNTVSVRCIGVLGVIFERNIGYAVWGNTHVVDETLTVAMTTSSGNITRLTAALDADKLPQTPLERLRFLMIQEGVWWCTMPMVWQVYDHGAGVSVQVAQQFMGCQGELRKIWVKGYQGAAGNNADLIFEVQTDNNGAPSGTVVTTYTSPRAGWGVGAANEAWMEINLIANVVDSTVLRLQPGGLYWLVIRVSAPGANNDYFIRCCDTTMGPNTRWAKESINAAAYALSATRLSIYYACDYEGHWQDLDMTRNEYMVETLKDGSNQVIFIRKTLGANDTGGQFSWNKYLNTFTVLYTGQALVRATYWKGAITYATVVLKWAQTVASDIYGATDISITEPAYAQYCVQLENASGLDGLNALLTYCPMVVRVYKSQAGVITLEVRDAKAPTVTVWNASYTVAQRAARSLYDGRDSPASQSYVRIVDGQVFRNMLKKVESSILKDMAGNILSAVGAVAGTGKSVQKSSPFFIGGIGTAFANQAGANESLLAAAITVQVGGTITVEGIDQSVATGPFRQPNELVYVKISRKGMDDYFAVQGIRWSGGKGQPTRLEMAFLNPTFVTRLASADKTVGLTGNYNFEKTKFLPGGSTTTLQRGKLATDRGKVDGGIGSISDPSGASDCPTSGLERVAPGISIRTDMPIMHRDGTHTYLPAKVYFLQIGTGVPAGVTLGYKVAEVIAQAFPMASGYVLIQAKFRAEDCLPNTVWPLLIKEVGIAYANDYLKAGITQVGAYSVDPISGGGTIWCEKAELMPGRRITVAIQVTKP